MNITLVSLILQVIALVNLLFIIFTVFIERKKPVSALAWILVLTFLPVVGFVLYLIFGINLRKTKKAQCYGSFAGQNGLPYDRLPAISDCFTEPISDMVQMHYNLGRYDYSMDNEVTIFTRGQEKYERLINDIENAACSIDMLYFIFKNDNIGQKIVEVLTKKAREGVGVRVIYDMRGSLKTPYKLFKGLISAGGKVSRIFPIKPGAYFKLNYFNHRKIVVIDGNIGYLGGMNIGDEYMGQFRNNIPWRDTHIRITGSAVNALQEKFLEDWYYTTGEKAVLAARNSLPAAEKTNKIGMQIVSSDPYSKFENIKWGFIKMIHSARKRLLIQTPYFIPDDAFLEALKIAAVSGVEVSLMLPAIPDKKFVYNVTLSYLSELLDFGVKVYLYPGFLHSKMIVMDDMITSIGTANTDIRSFVLDFETNAFIYDKNFSQQCTDIFEKDAEISRVVTREWFDSRGLLAKSLESFYRLFSPIL